MRSSRARVARTASSASCGLPDRAARIQRSITAARSASARRSADSSARPGRVRATVVVTASGASTALPGTEAGAVKVTPFTEYPAKGRATGGVHCHRFLKGEDTLQIAWVGPAPAMAAAGSGQPVDLPAAEGRRDGSGTPAPQAIAGVAGPLSVRLSQ